VKKNAKKIRLGFFIAFFYAFSSVLTAFMEIKEGVKKE
jgi:hypothetical protein